MKTKVLFLTLTVIFLLACGVSSEQMTATAAVAKAQTQTAAPTLTRTPTATLTFTPTATPKPTETLEPTQTSTPVPAAVGETVEYKGLEITLLEVVTHTQVMLSDFYGYDAKDGYIFVDLAVRVRNKGTQAFDAMMGEIYLVDMDGKDWQVFGGGFKTVNLERPFNPLASIKLEFIPSDQVIHFEKDTYLRFVWAVPEHQNFLFGIQDATPFAVSVK